jgi:simple sugar transport system ATP-binding protein
LNKFDLAKMMVGHEVNFSLNKTKVNTGATALELKNVDVLNMLGHPALHQISLSVSQGEILGIAGVDGNGQSELMEVITGLRPASAGNVLIDGVDATNRSSREVMERFVGHIPEDRQARGLVMDMNIEENFILRDYYIKPHTRKGFLNWGYIREHTSKTIMEYDIRGASDRITARNLSGGNQQKLILARELHRLPHVLVAMHATRGLDVGAIEYMHGKMLEQRAAGAAILYISTEIDELLSLCDRIAVISHGRIMGIVDPNEIGIEQLGLMMAGTTLESMRQ